MRKRIIFIVGPTGIGKTGAALILAKKIGAEIISCDSMQVYKGMDILTSKPSLAQRKAVPHHLIGIVLPGKEYDVSKYRKEALNSIGEVIKRGKTPLFVGGTGLYMSVLIDGLFDINAKDKNVRRHLEQDSRKYGSNYLHKKLEEIDPLAASKIHPNDLKRIIRAIEVFKVAGKPISWLQKNRQGLGNKYEVKIFCLNVDREVLYKRINERVEAMFKNGLEKEVKHLLKTKLSRTAGYAIGIKELKGYFEGLYDMEAAKELIKRNTRRYAKRQLTWFRKDKRINWVEIKANETPIHIANRICKLVK